jgi:two-component system chemotaxis response regulator CheB
MKKVKVLIVDDSALIRQLLTSILTASNKIDVVGTAPDPIVAREQIKKLNPDVLTLDIEMPKMDGLSFLKKLMRLRPMPVVMISSLTEKGADATLRAMDLGAVDFISKPRVDIANGLQAYADEIIAKVLIAANSKLSLQRQPLSSVTKTVSDRQSLECLDNNKIIAIGASTGGTEALKILIQQLPATMPAILVTQHLPVAFSQSFARHVKDVAKMDVCIAEDQQRIEAGRVYIAPGNRHLEIVQAGSEYQCRLKDGPAVNRHKPSVDVMFRSVAQNVGKNAIGVLLTGMGADGAQAMMEMKQCGATNIVQDEETSIVWGMPGEAYKLGAADFVLPLNDIARQIMALL